MIALGTAIVRRFPKIVAMGNTSLCGNVEWLDLVVSGPRGECTINISLSEGEYHVHANDNPHPIAVFWSVSAVYLFCLSIVPIAQAVVDRPLPSVLEGMTISIEVML